MRIKFITLLSLESRSIALGVNSDLIFARFITVFPKTLEHAHRNGKHIIEI